MLSHHLLVALRALRRDAGYALLNGIGLTVALACCVLIGLFVRSELTFDRFHADADRIVIVGQESKFGQDMSTTAATPYPLHLRLAEEAPAVEVAAAASQGAETVAVIYGGTPFLEQKALYATPSFFEILDFSALEGDPVSGLASPEAVVITESAAARFFGGAPAMGQLLAVESRGDTLNVTVAAVVSDPPRSSHAQFDLVLPMAAVDESQRKVDGWFMSTWRTYARLAPEATVADLDAQAVAIADTYHAHADMDGYEPPRYFGVGLTDYRYSDLYYSQGFLGNARYLALFSGAALLILLLGLINYVNLATARAERRAREVGVRKVLGAGRAGVAMQFLAEAAVLTLASGAAALVLAAFALPTFNDGFGTELVLADLDAAFIGAVLLASVVVGLLAGAYPAFVLARLDPATVLRGGATRSGRPSRNVLRRSLVAAQFAVAIGLLASTGVVLQQIAFSSGSDLGFAPEAVVSLPVGSGRGADVPWQPLLDGVRQSAHVQAAVATNGYPGAVSNWFEVQKEDNPNEGIVVANIEAEPGLVDALSLGLVSGRDLREGEKAALVNEALVREMGWDSPEAALGKTIAHSQEVTVVGVARDFHVGSMRDKIMPAILVENVPYDEGRAKAYRYVLAKVAPGRMTAALADMETAWERTGTEKPFDPLFLDETVANLYKAERSLAGILGAFSLVAVLVACLGLVGLAAYTAQRRTREIGVRRALGASVGQIVALLSREYALLVAAGAAIAVPLSVWLVGRWLDGFAYRISLGPGLFVGAVALTLAIALAVVGVQAARAARVPPTRALRAD